MCGICGWVTDGYYMKSEVLNEMCNTMVHRGPDDDGYYVNEKMGIGMRRLSVIDLSLGRQPIHNEDKSIWIVFNGEIYNYLELRAELEASGHEFYTNSDTEVIVHLYEDYGEKTPEKLRGMFAFAIIDERKEQLYIARDRMGIKPLYYYRSGTDFLFASEIKSILKFPSFSKIPNYSSINQYFTFGYIPHNMTMFEGIYKLLPGHFLVFKNNQIRFGRYWDFPVLKNNDLSESEYIESFFQLFSDCVKKHLISDVPLGMFLSGGIDSSIILGQMAHLANRRIDTFSIGFDGDCSIFDERAYSSKVSEIFNTNHREIVIRPDIIEVLPRVIYHCDEPIGDASVILTYYLSEYVRKYVTVSLSGLGGDELCGGYERYLGAIKAESYNKIPIILRNKLNIFFENISDSSTGAQFPQRIKRFVRHSSLPLQDRYYNFICKFNDSEKRNLFTFQDMNEMDFESGRKTYDLYWESSDRFDDLQKLLKFDMETFLTDNLLALTDRVSMAHSLEVRVPFLDHEIVEFFWKIPSRYKIKGFNKKYFLKKAAERILPKQIIYRKKKGFSIPLSIWFRGSLKKYVKETLNDSNIDHIGYINKYYINEILEDHFRGKSNHDEKIFMLISFVLWHKRHF